MRLSPLAVERLMPEESISVKRIRLAFSSEVHLGACFGIKLLSFFGCRIARKGWPEYFGNAGFNLRIRGGMDWKRRPISSEYATGYSEK